MGAPSATPTETGRRPRDCLVSQATRRSWPLCDLLIMTGLTSRRWVLISTGLAAVHMLAWPYMAVASATVAVYRLLAERERRKTLLDLVSRAPAGTIVVMEKGPGGPAMWVKEVSHFRRRQAFRRRQPELHRRYQAAESDPEQQALFGLAVKKAAKIIKGLPVRRRRIALMKWNDHMKESEIAAELGCSKGTVAAEVQRIRRTLIHGLGPYYPFAEEDSQGGTS